MAAGRNCRPSDHVPYGFEKRVMARLADARPESLYDWSRALWRGAMACAAAAALLSGWAVFATDGPRSATHLSEVLDSTVFVMAEQMDDSW